MRILVTDAFCSANRGDAAILDGILTGLAERLPGVQLEVSSHFPSLTRGIHGVDAVDDRDAVAVARAIDRADLVVGCGGSYLHDLYALNLHPRLATIAACARVGRPFAVFGQSIGPLDSPLSRTAARNALNQASWICVRDAASARVVQGLGVTAPLTVGVDAAILGRVTAEPRRDPAVPVLAVTVRSWHFPDTGQDPAEAQARYEQSVAEACIAWRRHTGGRVRFLSNCTALGGYAQDDRIPARRVAGLVGAGAEVVESLVLPFDVVRGQAAAADFLLGTRMHSLLFATTAHVPAVGIAYEFKTPEWMQLVGTPDLWRPIEAPAGLEDLLVDAWDHREEHRATLEATIPVLKQRAAAQLDTLAELAGGVAPVASARSQVATGRGDWNLETWKYDRPHRRLRAVVDTVVAEETGGRVLDVGCSSGLLGRMLGARFDYLGLDIAPSVAASEPHFSVRTASLDGEWPLPTDAAGEVVPFDVVVASGALEYVEDLPGTVSRLRSVLRPGGLAVVTLFNLAHVSRGPNATRHPTWRFDMRPDEFVLHLREAGLAPVRLFASSAGRVPAPAVNGESPTDLDRAGATQLAMPALFRLGHHLVVVCRTSEPRAGITELGRRFGAGDVKGALRLGVELAREAPWSARVWSDLGVLWSHVGDRKQAQACLARAFELDPTRPGLAEDLRAA